MGLTITGRAFVTQPVIGESPYYQELHLGYPLQGSLPAFFRALGSNQTLATGLLGSNATVRETGNQRLHLVVNSLTGAGTVTVSGDSVDESTGVPVVGDSEQVTVDATGGYQTDRKWWRVTAVTVTGAVTAINYDLRVLGYFDFQRRDFTVEGYRVEVDAVTGTNRDFHLTLNKVQDEGNKKVSIVPLEDVLLSRAAGVTDNLRTGPANRSILVPMFEQTDRQYAFETSDFRSFFVSDEPFIEAELKKEGIFLALDWLNIDFFSLAIRFLPGIRGL